MKWFTFSAFTKGLTVRRFFCFLADISRVMRLGARSTPATAGDGHREANHHTRWRRRQLTDDVAELLVARAGLVGLHNDGLLAGVAATKDDDDTAGLDAGGRGGGGQRQGQWGLDAARPRA